MNSEKRGFIEKQANTKATVHIHREKDGKLTFLREEEWDTVAHRIEPTAMQIAIAERLFAADPREPIPCFSFNLDQPLTADDIDACLHLDSTRRKWLAALSSVLHKVDLFFPSHIRRADETLMLAKAYLRESLQASRQEEKIKMFTNRQAFSLYKTTTPELELFDGWSEGPFTPDEVERYVEADPCRATEFHTRDGRTWQELFRNTAIQPDDDCMGQLNCRETMYERRSADSWLRWPAAALVLVAVVSFIIVLTITG